MKKGPKFYKTSFPEEEPISVEEQKNIKRDLYKGLFKKDFLNIKIEQRSNFSEVNFFSKLVEAGKLPKLHSFFED